MYTIDISYNTYSGYLGNGGPTLETAQAHLTEMVAFYAGQDAVIRDAYILETCDHCQHGAVLKCAAPKRHHRGTHGERCYKRCQICKGQYRLARHDAASVTT